MLRFLSGKKSIRTYQRKNSIELLILTLPAVIVLFFVNYLPMGGIIVAFKNYKGSMGIFGSPWSEPLFKNFEFFFKSSVIVEVTRNTILYNLVFLIVGNFCGIMVAIFLNELKRIYVKFYQMVFFFPYFLSWVIVAIMLYTFLNYQHGFLNKILGIFGIKPVSWYTQPQYWPFILTFANLWKYLGHTSIIYYAALMGIDPGLYESATMDGCSKFRQIIHITIPMLSPMIVIIVILRLGHILYADFGLFYQLTMQIPSLLETTDVISYFTFRALMVMQDYGMASAAGFYTSIIGFCLVLFTNWAAKKISHGEKSLF